MNRRRFVQAQAGAFAWFGIARLLSRAEGPGGRVKPPRRGVSLAGAEFGTQKADFCNDNPGAFGRDYTYNSERTVAYFCEKNFGLLRLPLRWERVQPRPGQALDEAE